MSGMVLYMYDPFILQVSEKDSLDTSDLVEEAFWNLLFRRLAISLESGCNNPCIVLLSDLLCLI